VGLFFYAILFITVFSITLFYALQLKILKPVNHQRICYLALYSALGSAWLLIGFAVVIPFFKDMFAQLESFFGNISDKM
jgi:membrane protein required for colicin V production